MEIRRITHAKEVTAAGHLFDDPPQPVATEKFLADQRHHLLVAYVDEAPAGTVTGVEMTHPDKGTEARQPEGVRQLTYAACPFDPGRTGRRKSAH